MPWRRRREEEKLLDEDGRWRRGDKDRERRRWRIEGGKGGDRKKKMKVNRWKSKRQNGKEGDEE